MPTLEDPFLILPGVHILIGLVLVLITALPCNQVRHIITCSSLIGILASLPFTSSGFKCVDWGTGTVVSSYLLLYTCFFVLSDAEKQFWRVGDKVVDLHIAEKSYGRRLFWGFSLWTSFRGVGWNWHISKMPAPVSPGYSVRFGSFQPIIC